MELDQVLFKRFYNFLTKRKEVAAKEFAVELSDLQSRFTLIARALSGRSVEIYPSEREGGHKNNVFYLPREVNLFDSLESNFQFYLYRLVYLCIQSQLNLNLDSTSEKVQDAQDQAHVASKLILLELVQEYPSVWKTFKSLSESFENSQEEPDWSWFYGRFYFDPEFDPNKVLENVQMEDKQLPKNEIETEIEARHADEVETATIDKKAQEDYVLTHNFEKVETVDEFNGVMRDFDGDDDLKEDQQALEQVNLRHMVRVDDPVHSIYRSEMAGGTLMESKTTDLEGFHLNYPEWDFKTNQYIPNYCKIYPSYSSKSDLKYYKETITHHKKTLTELRKVFSQINNERQVLRRQAIGENIDIDALTDRFVDVHSKRTPDERVYLSTAKRRKDISLLFLLDLSLSSDGYAKGNRIIDVEKQVAILFGEVLAEFGINFQVDGFYSKTRNKTSYVHIKSFGESWTKGRANFGKIEPQSYTRIGPALRHASFLLGKENTRKKWLILLSDGKPNDYDRYEGKHGIRDIQQALREIRANNIGTYAVAIEEQAKYYLPQMFGHNHYNILSKPVEMIQSLTKLYMRIQMGN